jgi:hypothetical protein
MFLFFLTLILLPAFGEPSPVYDEPYSPIFTDKPVYSWTDKIKITIISPSWNSNRYAIDSIGNIDSHPIKVATSENSLKSYKLIETDVNSGIFIGEVILTGFAHDADGDGHVDTIPRTTGNGPTGGFLESDRDSAITISFEFADGIVLVESVPVSWNLGTVSFLKEFFFLDDDVIVRVVDVDMNLNPESLDTVPIHLFSDSDVAGIEVNAVETSVSSGSFVATISTSQNLPSSGNRLYALPGDEIFVKYDDHTLPKPFAKSDHLEINSSVKIDSPIPYLERLEISSPIFSDGVGNNLESFSSNIQIQIVGSVVNNHDLKQPFAYIFQIKNNNNFVEHVSWIQGELLTQQALDVSQSWIPKKPGIYTVETFVWNSIIDPTALSASTSVLFTVE